MTLDPDVVHEDDELRIVTWSVVIASRWKATPTKEKIDLLGKHRRSLAQAITDGRIITLNVLAPDTGALLSSTAREATTAIAREGRDYLIGSAQVVEGEGFGAAAARAVMSGIQLAVRAGYPNKVFGSVEEAMHWVAELLRGSDHERDASEIAAALQPLVGPG